MNTQKVVKKAELTNSEVQQIVGRTGIIKELDQDISKTQYLQQAAVNDVQKFIKELAVKHGLEAGRDYVVKDGVIMVDESTTAPAGGTEGESTSESTTEEPQKEETTEEAETPENQG